MKAICKIVDISTDFISKKPKIALEMLDSDMFDEDELNKLASKDSINVELTLVTRKRNLSQNDMSWVLQKQLAKKLNLGNDELHQRLIKEYSDYDTILMRSDIDPVRYFDYYDVVSHTIGKDGRQYTYYKVYIPSHKMTTIQFGRYMDGIIRECEDNGIHTLKWKY